ncbi:MAG: hypothetical protein KY475_26540 [Planctomycetes bacterium]|nr:hypothetical protein [Planctomycetota bacterium]
MTKAWIMAAVTLAAAAGCAHDRGCYDGWSAFGDPYADGVYGDGVVYGDSGFGDYIVEGEHPIYLPDGAVVGPEVLVPGGETIPVPAGEPLPGPAQ